MLEIYNCIMAIVSFCAAGYITYLFSKDNK